MTEITCIEFCKNKFKTLKECHDWIDSSEYKDVRRLKEFKLRSTRNPVFLTSEKKRPVYTYKVNLHKYQTLESDRYPGVIVVSGESPFSETVIPEMLPENFAFQEEKRKEKERKAEESRIKKEKARAIRKQEKEERDRIRGNVKDTTKKRKTKKEKEEEKYGIKLEPIATVFPL